MKSVQATLEIQTNDELSEGPDWDDEYEKLY